MSRTRNWPSVCKTNSLPTELQLHNLVAGAGLEPATFGLWAQRGNHSSIPQQFYILAGKIGFEPMNAGAKIQCLTTWLLPNMVSAEGFEPSFSSSQAKRITWLSYTEILVPPAGFEPVRIFPPDPKSGVSTSSTTEAYYFFWQDRRDLNPQLLGRQPSALTIWTTALYWREETESNRWHVDFQSTALTNWAIFPSLVALRRIELRFPGWKPDVLNH